MAEHSIAIRFGIDNGAVVLRDLKAIGGNGEKALKRIEQAGRPASRALQAVSEVAAGVRSRIEGLSARLGSFGTGLSALGPTGLAVAAGLVAVAGAAAVVVGGLRKAIGITAEAVDTFDALDDQASQLGITAEQLQALSFSGLQIGVKTEETVKALIKLNDNLGEVLIKGTEVPKELAIAFARLRIPRQQIVATQGDLDQLLPAIADGFKNVKTQAERTAIAQALFGKQGAKLLPLLSEGKAGLAEFSRQAHQGGAVLKKEYVDILSTAGDKLADLRDRAKVAGGVIGAQFAGVNVKLEEFRTRLYQAVAGWIERSGIGAKVEQALTRIGAAIEQMIAKAGGADAVFDLISDKVGEFLRTLTGGTGTIDELADTVSKRIGEAGSTFAELAKSVNTVAEAIDGMGRAWRALANLNEDSKSWWITRALNSVGQGGNWVYRNVTRPLIGGGSAGGATGDMPAPRLPAAPAMPAAPKLPPAPAIPAAPQMPGQLVPVGPQTPVAVQRPLPSAAPARPSARPGTEGKHSALDIGGGVDINVRGPADVRRVHTRDPRVPIQVNQGWSMVG